MILTALGETKYARKAFSTIITKLLSKFKTNYKSETPPFTTPPLIRSWVPAEPARGSENVLGSDYRYSEIPPSLETRACSSRDNSTIH